MQNNIRLIKDESMLSQIVGGVKNEPVKVRPSPAPIARNPGGGLSVVTILRDIGEILESIGQFLVDLGGRGTVKTVIPGKQLLGA